MLFLKPKIELNHSAFLAAHLLGGFWRGLGMDRVGSGRRSATRHFLGREVLNENVFANSRPSSLSNGAKSITPVP
jgi:hypothetical protein